MRKKLLFKTLWLSIAICGCREEPIPEIVVTTYEPTDVDYTSATCGGDVVINIQGLTLSEIGICWSEHKTPTINDSYSSTKKVSECFVYKIPNLKPDTDYYVRAVALRGTQPYYGEEKKFHTVFYSGVDINTLEAADITYDSAKLYGSILSDGGISIESRGFCWSDKPNPSLEDRVLQCGRGSGDFNCVIRSLTPNTTYYVRAFANNTVGVFFGDIQVFTTSPANPLLANLIATNVTGESATLQAEITSQGMSAVTEKGFCWGTNHNPTISDNVYNCGAGTNSFKATITNLVPASTYYIRAFAKNQHGIGYTEELEVKTSKTIPSIKLRDSETIRNTSASVSGEITQDGGASIIEKGFCWSTSPRPTIENEHIICGENAALYSGEITGLNPRTKYYYRAYARNECGIGYSEDRSFTTYDAPSLKSISIESITTKEAMLYASIQDDGGSRIIKKGFCWSTTSEPSLSNSYSEDGSDNGDFSHTITSLKPNTLYHCRAYASNEFGTSYSEDIQFKTKDGTIVLSTSSVSAIRAVTASCGGRISDDGGAAIISRGICWSTSATPSISSMTAIATSTGSEYSCKLTGLSLNTTYYVRAYATNEFGTYYGEVRQFTTQDGVIKISTAPVTKISYSSSQSGGTITTDGGGDIVKKGVCWSTHKTPTVLDSYSLDGSGSSSFVSVLSPLTSGTSYYIRAYAINEFGTYYGEEYHFTAHPIGSNGFLFSVSSDKKVFFSTGNLQYQPSSGLWRFAENEYDYIGTGNENFNDNYTGWLDVFQYGTSGYNGIPPNSYFRHAETCIANTYYDWGLYNCITNGENQSMIWRTLSAAEWNYLLSDRKDASKKWGYATVNGVPGFIFLPDEWNKPQGVSFTSGATNYLNNTYDLSQWGQMSSSGAVFLPAAGYRDSYGAGSRIAIMKNIGVEGDYFSTEYRSTPSPYANYFTYIFSFNLDGVVSVKEVSFYRVGYGGNCYSVRLVSDTK